MIRLIKVTPLVACFVIALGCSSPTVQTTESVPQSVSAASEQANQLFDEIFNVQVARSPTFQTYLGLKTDYDKWDDLSESFAQETLAFNQQQLSRLNELDSSKLDDATALSLKLLTQQFENAIADFQWRHHNYPVNQMFGTHSEVPSLLINQHLVSSVADARAYIARLNNVPLLFEQLIDGLNKRADKGILAPKFVFPYVIDDSRNIIKGAPFHSNAGDSNAGDSSADDGGADSTLYADFKRKIGTLSLTEVEQAELLADVERALIDSVGPAYRKLVGALEQLQTRADNRDGAWKFPDGADFYNNALARTTTTSLTAEQIHRIGLDEVARIHDEMRGIMRKVGFGGDGEGDLQAFFKFMRSDSQFYYPETEEGKQAYLTEATNIIEVMKGELDALFVTKPKADLKVQRVEAFREKSAGKAFYQPPSMDGSRPGLYYANLYRMSEMPIYQMEALAYHEGLPGHHMQIAIAQELQQVPQFRKYGRYTAYIEGWGLYSELLPKEIGFYQDPYSDFGRLAMELWRACRLVVDTGIHAMRWDRQQGIDYYAENSPNPIPDSVKMVERHIVMPSQATAYKIGMLKILELRTRAQLSLGDKFDIRQFHDMVLRNGAVPLNVLDDLVEEWIAKTSQG